MPLLRYTGALTGLLSLRTDYGRLQIGDQIEVPAETAALWLSPGTTKDGRLVADFEEVKRKRPTRHAAKSREDQ